MPFFWFLVKIRITPDSLSVLLKTLFEPFEYNFCWFLNSYKSRLYKCKNGDGMEGGEVG